MGLADRKHHRRAAGFGSGRSDGSSSSESSRCSVAAAVASDGPLKLPDAAWSRWVSLTGSVTAELLASGVDAEMATVADQPR